VSVDDLEPLAGALDADAMEHALHSIGAGHRARRLTAEIESAAQRIHDLVAAIKGFTYMDQHAIPARVSIRKALNDTLAVMASKARGRSVRVTVDIDDALPDVEGFGGELNQVWANLIDNAIDAAPDDGHVGVQAAARDGKVVVRVTDDGPGIPIGEREKLFLPYYSTKRRGSGLGLAIVRRIIAEHGGSVEVTDNAPHGTRFTIELPC